MDRVFRLRRRHLQLITLSGCSYNDLRSKSIFAGTFEDVTGLKVTLDGTEYVLETATEDGDTVWKYNGQTVDISTVSGKLTALKAGSADDFTDEQPALKKELGLEITLKDGAPFYESLITLQTFANLSRLQPALAGDVDGRHTASRPVCGRQYLVYISCERLPFVYTARMSAVSKIFVKSFGTTFRMELSLEPSMSQEWIESQAAISWRASISFFSSTVFGTGSSNSSAISFQKRFWGCP